jgi:hypothetical protein
MGVKLVESPPIDAHDYPSVEEEVIRALKEADIFVSGGW